MAGGGDEVRRDSDRSDGAEAMEDGVVGELQ